jgi:dTDP-glucose 4,6-dehydratase
MTGTIINQSQPAVILVTGAAGFIGSNFVRYWRQARPQDKVIALDALTYAGNLPNLDDVAGEFRFVQASITDADIIQEVLARYGVDLIVNFAAESHNSLGVLEPTRFYETNVMGTQTLLEAARHSGTVRRFHHISTCEVYGDLDLDTDEAFSESSPYRPRTPYNSSKAAADHAVRAYHETFGLPVTITNCANNYGPYQFPEKVVPLFVTNALEGRDLPMYASRDHRREWIHVTDHCEAVAKVLLHGRTGATYNIGTGHECTIEEIADLVLDELGLDASLKTIVPDRPGHDRRYLLDSSLIGRELGWSPRIGFQEGMRATVRWYRDHPEWWSGLRDRRPVTENGSLHLSAEPVGV